MGSSEGPSLDLHVYTRMRIGVWSTFTVHCALMMQRWCIYGDSTKIDFEF